MKLKKHIPNIPFQNYRNLLIFLIGMAVLSLISRAADSFMVPQVTTASPEDMRLTYPLEIEGSVTAKESHAIYCMENLRVARVDIQPNDMVKKGDLLFSIDREDLEEHIKQAEQELQKLAIQIKALEEAQTAQASQHSLAASRATEDYHDISTSSGAAVDATYRELEQAKEELALHDNQRPMEYAALEQAGTSSAELKEPDATENKEATEPSTDLAELKEPDATGNKEATEPNTDLAAPEEPDATGNKEATEPSTDLSAPEKHPFTAWLQKRGELEKTCLEKEKQYEEAVAARNESLKTAARQLEDASLPVAADGSQALLQLEQENAARTLQELKSLSQAEGKVYSEYDGQVLACNISIGSATTGEPAILLADFSQPLQFEGIMEETGELPMEEGATGTLHIEGQSSVLEGVEISGISQESGGFCRVTAALDSYEVSKAGTAVLDITWESRRYPCCIPLSALYSGETGDFVIKVTEKPTILGLQATAEYVPVTVLEKNSMYAAVESGLSPTDRMIVNASKTIKEGDRIRVTEH